MKLKLIQLLFILLFNVNSISGQKNDFNFKMIFLSDLKHLKKNREMLLLKETNYKKFKKFKHLSISTYQYKSKAYLNHTIEIWSNPNKKIDSLVKITSRYYVKNDTSKTFTFHTFYFKKHKKSYTYWHNSIEGLLEYRIDTVNYDIDRKAIISGFDEIYFKSKQEINFVLNHLNKLT